MKKPFLLVLVGICLLFSTSFSSVDIAKAIIDTSLTTPAPDEFVLESFVPTIGLSPSSAALSWKHVENARSYIIYRSEEKTNNNYSKIGEVTSNHFLDKTIKAGIKYYYKVEATRGEIVSKHLQIAEKSMPTATPSSTPLSNGATKLNAPKNIKVANKGSYNLISWSKVKDATRYIIYRSKYSNKNFTQIASSTQPEHKDYNVTEGEAYYYQVVGTNGNVQSKPATSRKVTVPTPSPIPYQRMSYKTLARNPEYYKGQYVRLNNCRVVQQLDFDNSSDIELIVTVGGNRNVVYFDVPGFKDWSWGGSFAETGVNRLLVGDKIDITGKVLGEHSYETIDGRTLTVPLIELDYMWLYD